MLIQNSIMEFMKRPDNVKNQNRWDTNGFVVQRYQIDDPDSDPDYFPKKTTNYSKESMLPRSCIAGCAL